jgi:hypothetical protein
MGKRGKLVDCIGKSSKHKNQPTEARKQSINKRQERSIVENRNKTANFKQEERGGGFESR